VCALAVLSMDSPRLPAGLGSRGSLDLSMDGLILASVGLFRSHTKERACAPAVLVVPTPVTTPPGPCTSPPFFIACASAHFFLSFLVLARSAASRRHTACFISFPISFDVFSAVTCMHTAIEGHVPPTRPESRTRRFRTEWQCAPDSCVRVCGRASGTSQLIRGREGKMSDIAV
jgi:hypothetical protein